MAESMQRICVRRNGRTIPQNGLPAKKKADRRLEATGPQLAVLSWLLMKIDQLRVRIRILG